MQVQVNDLFSRILGVLVFLGGIALLLLVFKIAHIMFSSDLSGFTLTAAKDAQPGTTTAALGESAIKLFVRIVLLLLMSAVASIIAGKGINLYFAATGRCAAQGDKQISE